MKVSIIANKYKEESTELLGRICFALVNYKKNHKALQQIPHRHFLDLAVIYYIYDDEMDKDIFRIAINYHDMYKLGLEEESLWNFARENTSQLQRPYFSGIHDVDDNDITGKTERTSYNLSNMNHIFGSAYLAYNEYMIVWAEVLWSSYYIIPLSIHECIIIKDKGNYTEEDLRQIVKDANPTILFNEEKLLSDSVYYFDRVEQKLLII